MVNPHGLGPTKMSRVKHPEYAMYCKSTYGPSFGGGHDLHISGNANSNISSHSVLGFSYEGPPSGQQSTFFAGAQSFSVTDYEVFGLYN